MKTNIIYTIIGTILIISVIAVMGYIIKTQRDMIGSIEQNNKQQVLLKDNITRIESSLLTPEEFNKRLKGLDVDLDVIKNDLASVGGKVNEILISKTNTPGGTYTRLPSTITIPINNKPPVISNCPNCIVDNFGYFSNIQKLNLNEPLSNDTFVPWGSVEFNASEKNPWSYEVKPRTYSSTFILATDAEGDKRAYTKMSITVNDKKYDMPEVQTSYLERFPSPSLFLWNPRLMGGVDIGYSTNSKYTIIPSAQVFISSYGDTKRNSTWNFGGFGAGYDIVTNNYVLMATPFVYKPTSKNSIIQNTYVGPSIGVDFSGKVYGNVGIKIGF